MVVLYVNDPGACGRFWVEQVGMIGRRRDVVGPYTIAWVGFTDQPFDFELVPPEMMKDNPDGLDLATPSIAFQVADLEAIDSDLVGRGGQATDVGDHQGTASFAFSNPEVRWFAVPQSAADRRTRTSASHTVSVWNVGRKKLLNPVAI